ncbi:MAG: hypothetical protein KDD69_05065, partial [Bdellovibrionales bacterium]|nr:hypothetical protein [Bdellovibrionales bacterium]
MPNFILASIYLGAAGPRRQSSRSIWTYFSFYVAVTLLSLIAFTSYATKAFRSFFRSHVSASLERSAEAVAERIEARNLDK